MAQVLRVEQEDGIVVITPLREISELADQGVDEAVQQALASYAASNSPNLLLDFKFIDWLGSAMLEIIVTFWKDTNSAGGKLASCNVSEVGIEAMKLTKLDSLGTFYETRQDAIEALRV